MAFFNRQYLEEVYKSKYADFLDDDEDLEEDDRIENEEKKDEPKKDLAPKHLSKPEILKARNQAVLILSNFKRLKKCCDIIDLSDKDHINDDGERESSFGEYYNNDAEAFIKLMDGDVFSGYPDYRSGGNEAYEKDSKEYVKAVNGSFQRMGLKIKFMVGRDRDEEAISFGIKSLKKKDK